MKNTSLVFIVNFGNQLINHSFVTSHLLLCGSHFCVKCTLVPVGIIDNQSNYMYELYTEFSY